MKMNRQKRRILSALAGAAVGPLIYFAPGSPYPLLLGLALVLFGYAALTGKARKEGGCDVN